MPRPPGEPTLHDQLLDALINERLRRNWTQRDVAERMGVSASWVCALESGQHAPRMETLQLWASVLDLEISITRVDRHGRK